MQSTITQLGILLIAVANTGELLAQSHRPCQIVYLVRDEKGEPLDPAQLAAIESAKGEEMKPGMTWLKNPDGSTRDDVKALLSRLDIGGDPVALSQMTLKHGGKTMRLIFNVKVVEQKRVIDSVAFQQGTFKLDKDKWVKVE